MPPYRAQFFFQDTDVGWSETYWNVSAASVSDLIVRAKKLAPKRVGLLGTGPIALATPGPVLTYIRGEDLANKNQTLIAVQSDVPQGSKERASGTSEVPWSTILLRFTFGDPGHIYRAMRMLSGVPDDVVVDPPGPVVSTDWFKNFALFKSFITDANNGWGLPHATYTPLAGGVTINNVAWAAPGQLTITFSAIPPLSSPSVIYLRGFTPRQWNGPVSIAAALSPPGTVWVTSGKTFKPVGSMAQVGSANVRGIVVGPISDLAIRGETHRARGRPFGQPRGRRPVRAK